MTNLIIIILDILLFYIIAKFTNRITITKDQFSSDEIWLGGIFAVNIVIAHVYTESFVDMLIMAATSLCVAIILIMLFIHYASKPTVKLCYVFQICFREINEVELMSVSTNIETTINSIRNYVSKHNLIFEGHKFSEFETELYLVSDRPFTTEITDFNNRVDIRVSSEELLDEVD